MQVSPDPLRPPAPHLLKFIDDALKNRDNPQVLEEIRLKVVELNKNFPLP